MNDAPILLAPQVLAKPWGGGRQLRGLGLPVPEEPPTGEVWLVSDVPGRSSVVVSGPGQGGTLEALLRADGPAVLGAAAAPGGRFPLLVKLLEVRGALSLQVHPDGEQARRHGDGSCGKFEAWTVLATLPGARTTLGFDREMTPGQVRALIASRRLEEGLNTFDAAPGDAYVIAPGTVHAARGGLLLLEVQETADVTYRLYDWGSVGLDGRPRELHLEKALSVADLRPFTPRRPAAPTATPVAPGARRRSIVPSTTATHPRSPFTFELVELDAHASYPLGGDRRPWVVVALEGLVSLGSTELGPGCAAIWPAASPATAVHAEGGSCAFALATTASVGHQDLPSGTPSIDRYGVLERPQFEDLS